jgi:Type II restriction endonuclease EcoO109I
VAGHPDLPTDIQPLVLDKTDIFKSLKRIDSDSSSRNRILRMESEFRKRIGTHIKGLPEAGSKFQKFSTNPFVLMFYSKQKSYSRVAHIEKDLVPAKVFSSMETSAGNMVEQVFLPVYGWEVVQSKMHSHQSLLDGRKVDQKSDTFIGATLKSGPRTLNDDMAKGIGNELVHRAHSWAVNHGVKQVDFTYGVLYGTRKQSNKKDWHILRNIDESRPAQSRLITPHKGGWSISYSDGALTVSATVRIGIEWWEFLGGKDTWLELCCALIRSCVVPADQVAAPPNYTISDLYDILDLSMIDEDFNVSVIQRSQFEWILFLARHFSDGFSPI